VDACDLNLEALKTSPPGKGELFVYDITERNNELQERYDFIFLMDVIEHIDDHIAFLNAAKFHLKKGGYAVINVPAITSLYSKYDVAAGHKRRYSKIKLSETVLASGFSSIEIIPWGLTLVPLLFLRKLRLVWTRPDKVIEIGFRPPNILADSFLQRLKVMETTLLNSAPFGTSLLAIARN